MADIISNALSSLALITPQNNFGYQALNPDGSALPPLLFHIEGENTITLDSDITDHYTEENDSIQDQWALKPEIVTVHGFIGELNDIPAGQFINRELAAAAAAIAPGVATVARLPILSAFSPHLTLTAQNIFNSAFQGYQTVAAAANTVGAAWSSIVNGNPQLQTKQSVMFNQFATYRNQRLLWKIQTPWAILDNMAIQSLKATQDDTTRMITDFFITFKRIRTASTPTVVDQATFAGRSSSQAAPAADSGTNTLSLGPTMTEQLAASTFGGF